MKIITYSDIHLEFGSPLKAPECDADVMILAGDIVTFGNIKPLTAFLKGWLNPVIYIAGNHEYYNPSITMAIGRKNLRKWLQHHKNVHFLDNTSITIEGVNFFGGTMWTDFNGKDRYHMQLAERRMNDYRMIKIGDMPISADDTYRFHAEYVYELRQWFAKGLSGKHVVVSHHCPGVNPNTKYKDSIMNAAYNSLDMIPIIEEFQPALWMSGHTHECHDMMIGNTRLISNQSGYPQRMWKSLVYECKEFDTTGKMVEI